MFYKIEPIDKCYREVDKLVHGYYEDKSLLDGMPEVDMDWEHYKRLQRDNMLLVITCRNDADKLIGVGMYVIGPHMHYTGRTFGFCDILAVAPEHRNKGIGKTIVKAAEIRLRDLGVEFMAHNFRTVYDTKPMFPKLGFRLSEQCYIKELV